MVQVLITILLIYSQFSYCDQSKQVFSTALTATYKQSGTEEYINTFVKDLDTKYLPEELKKEGGLAFVLLRCTMNRQLTLKWTF